MAEFFIRIYRDKVTSLSFYVEECCIFTARVKEIVNENSIQQGALKIKLFSNRNMHEILYSDTSIKRYITSNTYYMNKGDIVLSNDNLKALNDILHAFKIQPYEIIDGELIDCLYNPV